MTDLYDDLKQLAVKDHKNDDDTFTEQCIREKADRVVELDGGCGGIVALRIGELHVSFVVLQWHSSDDKGVSHFERLFHGSGPSGYLRELRHTFWGEPDNGGYIFYPSAKLIADAFRVLGEWFDCD